MVSSPGHLIASLFRQARQKQTCQSLSACTQSAYAQYTRGTCTCTCTCSWTQGIASLASEVLVCFCFIY